MARYICQNCGYIYNPEEGNPSSGIFAGVNFKDLPDNWLCPQCGKGKEQFKKINKLIRHNIKSCSSSSWIRGSTCFQ